MLITRRTWKLQADVSIVETFGFGTPPSLATLRIIASKTMTKTRLSFSQAFSNLLEQLSVRLWLFNARILNYRLDLAVDVERWDLPTIYIYIYTVDTDTRSYKRIQHRLNPALVI